MANPSRKFSFNIANLNEEQLEILNSTFKDIAFTSNTTEVEYNTNYENFSIKIGSHLPHTIGNMGIEVERNRAKIIQKKPSNNQPLSFKSVTGSNLFSIPDEELKASIRKVSDFLSENFGLQKSFGFLENKGGVIFPQIIDLDTINKVSLLDSKKRQEKQLELYRNSGFVNQPLDDTKMKNFDEFLKLQKEIIIKTSLTKILLKNKINKILEEMFNYANDNNLLESHIYKSLSVGSSKENLANRVKSFVVDNNLLSAYEINRKELYSFILKEDTNSKDSLSNETREIFDFYEKHPNSSNTLKSYFKILRDYNENKVKEELDNKTEIGNEISSLLQSNFRSFLFPQGTDISKEKIDEIFNQNISQEKIELLLPNKKNLESEVINNSYLVVEKINNNEQLSLYEDFKTSLLDSDVKLYFDISGLDAIDQNTKNKLLKNNNNSTFIVANKDFHYSDDFRFNFYYEINNNEKMILSLMADFKVEEKDKNEKLYTDANDLIIDNSVYLEKLFNQNAELKNKFLQIKTNFNKTNAITDIIDNPNLIKEIAKNSLDIKTIPTHATTDKENNSPAPIRDKENSDLTDIENINKNIVLSEAYLKPGYDLEFYSKNEVEKNPSFALEGRSKNLGYPIKISLNTPINKKMIQIITDRAIDEFYSTFESSQDDNFQNKIADLKEKTHKQANALLLDENSDSMFLNITTKLDTSLDGITMLIPFENFAVINKDGKFMGHINIPGGFIYKHLIEADLLDMSSNRLSAPPLSSVSIQGLYNNLLHNEEFILSSLSADRKEIELRTKDLLNFMKKDTTDYYKAIDDIFLGTFSKSNEGLKTDDEIKDDISYLLDLADDYLQDKLTYKTKTEVQNFVLSHKDYLLLSNSTKEVIGNIINYEIKEFGNQNNERLIKLYSDLKQLTSSDKILADNYETIIKELTSFKEGEEYRARARKQVASTFLYIAQAKDTMTDIKHIVIFKKQLSEIAEKNKERFKLEKANDFPIKAINFDNIRKKENISRGEIEILDFLDSNENPTLKDFKEHIDKKINSYYQELSSIIENKLKSVNMLRDYQARAILSIVNSQKLSNVSINLPPRGGKTITTVGSILLSHNHNNARPDSLMSSFFVQQKNYEDILKQVLRHFPEYLHSINFGNDLNMPYIGENYKLQNINRTAILNIPMKLKDLLNLEKSINNTPPRYELGYKFATTIASIKNFIDKKTKSEIEDIIKSNIAENKYFEIYADMIKGKNNWKVSALTSFYLNSIQKDGYLSENSYQEVRDIIINGYAETKTINDPKATSRIKLNLLPKSLLDTSLADEEVLANILSERNTKIKNQTYLNDGKKDINFSTDSSYISNSLDSQNEILKIISDNNENIDFSENSSLKNLGEEGKIVIFKDFVATGSRSKKQSIDTKKVSFNDSLENLNKFMIKQLNSAILDSLNVDGFKEEVYNYKKETLYRVLLDTFSEKITKLLKEGIDSKYYLPENYKNFTIDLNDIKFNGKNHIAYAIDIQDILKTTADEIKNIVATTKITLSSEIEGIATEDGLKNGDELIDKIYKNIDDIFDEFSTKFNKDTFLNIYGNIVYPKVNSSLGFYQKENWANLFRQYSDTTENGSSLEIIYKNKNSDVLLPMEVDIKNLDIGKDSIKISGKVFDGIDFTDKELKNFDTTLEIKKISNAYKTTISIDTSNESISYKANPSDKTYNISSSVVYLDEKNKKKVVAVDEAHKNETKSDNSTKLSGAALVKALEGSEKNIKVTGTPENNIPLLFHIRSVKNIFVALFSSLQQEIPIFNDAFKTFTADLINAKNKTEKLINEGFFKFCDTNIPDFSKKLDSLGDGNQLGILLDNKEAFAEDFNGFATRIALDLGYRVRENAKVSGEKNITKNSIPNFDFGDIDSYLKLDSLGSYEEIEKKLNTEKYTANAPVYGANYEKKNNYDILQLIENQNIKFVYSIGDNKGIENKPLADTINLAKKYLSLNKITNLNNAIDRICDAVFNSLSPNPNGLEKEQPNYETAKDKVKSNREYLKARLTDFHINDELKEIKNIDILLNSIGKDKRTSLVEITKELLKNNGKSPTLESYDNEKIRDEIEKRIQFSKEVIIPSILKFINTQGAIIKDGETEAMKGNQFVIDETTNFSVLFPVDIKENDYRWIITPTRYNDGYKIIDNLGERGFSNIEVEIGKNEITKLYPKISAYLNGDNIEPFTQKISSPNSAILQAFSVAIDSDFNDTLKYQIENNYKFPIATDRVASNLLATLNTLDKMISKQNADEFNGTLSTKTILALASTPSVASILKEIDTDKLFKEKNINFILINDVNNLQETIDKQNQQGHDPDVLILGRIQAAEGIQIRNFSVTKDDDCKILLPDGITATHNFFATIQFLMRIYGNETTAMSKEIKNSDEFRIPVKSFGIRYSILNSNKYPLTDIFNNINNLFSKGKLNAESVREYRKDPEIKSYLNSETTRTYISDSVKKTEHLLESFINGFSNKPNISEKNSSAYLSVAEKLLDEKLYSQDPKTKKNFDVTLTVPIEKNPNKDKIKIKA